MAGGKKRPRDSPTKGYQLNSPWIQVWWSSLSDNWVMVDKRGPLGPTNVPLFWRMVINIGGIIKVGLFRQLSSPNGPRGVEWRVQRKTYILVNTRLAADCMTAI
jgi:hypothetical protein